MSAKSRNNPNASKQPQRDDVVWGNIDLANYDDISLVPLDPDEEKRRPHLREAMLPLGVVYDDEPPALPQFSIRDIIIAQTLMAIPLALMRVFAPSFFAGTLGIMAMIFAALLTLHEPEDARIHKAWWVLFAVYLLACVSTLLFG